MSLEDASDECFCFLFICFIIIVVPPSPFPGNVFNNGHVLPPSKNQSTLWFNNLKKDLSDLKSQMQDVKRVNEELIEQLRRRDRADVSKIQYGQPFVPPSRASNTDAEPVNASEFAAPLSVESEPNTPINNHIHNNIGPMTIVLTCLFGLALLIGGTLLPSALMTSHLPPIPPIVPLPGVPKEINVSQNKTNWLRNKKLMQLNSAELEKDPGADTPLVLPPVNVGDVDQWFKSIEPFRNTERRGILEGRRMRAPTPINVAPEVSIVRYKHTKH